MPHAPLQPVATLGIDIGKNSFHLIGLDARGAIVLRQKLSRGQVEARQDGNHPTAATVVNAALPSG
jgi:transposase